MPNKSRKPGSLLVLFALLLATSAGAQTLEQAWAVALQADHSLKAVSENSAVAAQQLQAAQAARLPGLLVAAGYTAMEDDPAFKADFGGASVTFPVAEKDSHAYRARVTLPLYTSGRITQGIGAANAALQASRTEVSAKTLDVKLAVAEAYVGVLRAARRHDVASSHVSSLQAHAADVQNYYEQGIVSRNDLLAAEVALADAQQSEIKVANVLDIARSAYNRLLGRALNASVSLADIQAQPLGLSLEALSERAIKQRHELLFLQEQIRALRHRAAAFRAANGPQLALSGGYDYQENRYQLDEGLWSVNLGMQWQVFDGGVVHHSAQAVERHAAAVQEQFDDLRSRIALQVRQYWLDVQETAKRIPVTEKAIAQAEENLRVNRDRYEHGISTNTEVLDAETLRVASLYNHANATYDAVLASLRVKRSVAEL